MSDIEPKEDVSAQIGKRVRNLRRILNMNQQTLAGKLSISYQQLQKYESGRNNLSVPMLLKLSDSLKKPIDELLSDPEQKPEAVEILKILMNSPTASNPKELQEMINFLNQDSAASIKGALIGLTKALKKEKQNAE